MSTNDNELTDDVKDDLTDNFEEAEEYLEPRAVTAVARLSGGPGPVEISWPERISGSRKSWYRIGDQHVVKLEDMR